MFYLLKNEWRKIVVKTTFTILLNTKQTEPVYVTPKLFSFSRYLKLCLDFLLMHNSGLIRKIRLISKFMTSQHGNKTILIHLLPDISKSKGNLTMKFGQLIDYNMRNVFLKNHAQNV